MIDPRKFRIAVNNSLKGTRRVVDINMALER
jgi:hypothetical protein